MFSFVPTKVCIVRIDEAMKGIFLMLVAALVLRISGTALLLGPAKLAMRWTGWIFLSLSAWIVVSALGGWCAVWIPLSVGIVAAILCGKRRLPLAIHGVELGIAVLCAVVSVPP